MVIVSVLFAGAEIVFHCPACVVPGAQLVTLLETFVITIGVLTAIGIALAQLTPGTGVGVTVGVGVIVGVGVSANT